MRNDEFCLEHLVIKPTMECNQGCSYCIGRKKTAVVLEKAASSSPLPENRHMKPEEWARVFREADLIGVRYLDISGGEPLLYPRLLLLVREAKSLGWFTSLNTNGTLVTEEHISVFGKLKLDQIIVSMMGLSDGLHDRLRSSPGGCRKAMNAVALAGHSSMRTIIHFMVNRYNFREIPDLIDFAADMKVNGVALVYPENDQLSLSLLPASGELKEFREEILPRARDRYTKLFPSDEYQQSLKNLNGFYRPDGDVDYSRGIFASSGAPCGKPGRFMLIYPSGDVLPCNGAEYTGGPVAGNVLESSLEEVWNGKVYNDFRMEGMSYCTYCPIPRHTGIAIATTDNPPYAVDAVKRKPEDLPSREVVEEWVV